MSFISASILQLYTFGVNDWDFSYFSVLPWNIGNGFGWHVPFHEESGTFPFYVHHWIPFAAVLAPFLIIFESKYTLCIIHGIAIGIPFFLLPRIVKAIYFETNATNWQECALFLQLLFFCYVPFLAAWRYQTYLTTLVAPSIFAVILCLHKRKMLWAIFWCLILASGQERSSVAVLGVGMYAFLLLKMKLLGLFLCAFSASYFVGVLKLMVFLRGGVAYAFESALAGLYTLESYEITQKMLDTNPSIQFVADTGRLRVYASKDLLIKWKK